MPRDFSTEYDAMNDDELLHIASDRVSLESEASAALDAEMSRRGLTHADQVKHDRLVSRGEKLEKARQTRKLFGRKSWKEIRGDVAFFVFLLAIVLLVVYWYSQG